MALSEMRLRKSQGLNYLERSSYLYYSTEETPDSNQISLFSKVF